MIRVLNIVGLALSALFLLTALLTAPKFAITSQDKEEALARIEKTANGKEAGLVARPFLSLMMNVITSAKSSLLFSCGLVAFSGVVFFANIRASQRRARESNFVVAPAKNA